MSVGQRHERLILSFANDARFGGGWSRVGFARALRALPKATEATEPLGRIGWVPDLFRMGRGVIWAVEVEVSSGLWDPARRVAVERVYWWLDEIGYTLCLYTIDKYGRLAWLSPIPCDDERVSEVAA